MKTFNKKGDEGETSLLFGHRVPKSSLCCEAYGTLDKAASCLGIARNVVAKDKTKEVIRKIQKELFVVCSELATKPEDYKGFATNFVLVTDEMVEELEEIINELESSIEIPKVFVTPGSNLGSEWMDFSPTIIRRAERKVVDIKEINEISNNTILYYLSRLSDLLFVLGCNRLQRCIDICRERFSRYLPAPSRLGLLWNTAGSFSRAWDVVEV